METASTLFLYEYRFLMLNDVLSCLLYTLTLTLTLIVTEQETRRGRAIGVYHLIILLPHQSKETYPGRGLGWGLWTRL
jgi:hypothetical protein